MTNESQPTHEDVVAVPGSHGEFVPIRAEDIEDFADSKKRHSRFFYSKGFRRLWTAQVISSLGDWIGFLAIISIASRISGEQGGQAVSLVLVVRIVPGLFLGPLMGVVVDRIDRRVVMATCDTLRCVSIVSLLFADVLWQVLLIQFIIELATLAWSSAKDASVPELVTKDFLPTANSLSIMASYGTMPVGFGIYYLLSIVAAFASTHVQSLALTHRQNNLALVVDACTYASSALLVLGLPLRKPKIDRSVEAGSRPFSRSWAELKEGFSFIGKDLRIRSVMLGMATGIAGGAMIVPLGNFFAQQLLGSKGTEGFAALEAALGIGMAISVIAWIRLQKRVRHEDAFVYSVFGAGIAIFLASCAWTLPGAALFIFALGLSCGGVYVLGYTIIQANSPDHVRGRVFAAFYTLVRVCLVLGLLVAPLLMKAFGNLSDTWVDGDIYIAHHLVRLPGVRLTLWFGSLVIILAGVMALFSLRSARRIEASS